MTCTEQHLSFQNTPDNTLNVAHSPWDSFPCVQMYHNADASDVDSFSTHRVGTKAQPERSADGNCYGNNADVSYKLRPVVSRNCIKEFISEHIVGLTRIYNVCGVKDQRAWTCFMI